MFGLSNTVVVRLIAITGGLPKPGRPALVQQRASVAASSFPFRLRGNSVRVVAEQAPAPPLPAAAARVWFPLIAGDGQGQAPGGVSGALVFRRRPGQVRGVPIGGAALPRQTDSNGFLQGREPLAVGDMLVALQPITRTETYTVYHTSAPPSLSGVTPYTVTLEGAQTLAVSPRYPLLAFSLTVSLEWDARSDTEYLARLENQLQRTGELLYDWTDGQATLGDVTVYHNKGQWNDAQLRIYASNRLRPNAAQGGIVTSLLTETVILNGTPHIASYGPGQISIGATWNRYGDPGSNLFEDWPRVLAHELGHFALFLNDNYLGLDEQRRIVPVERCRGAMSDPYREDYSEFHPDAGWLEDCAGTLSQREVGRSDWKTITSFYPWLRAPTAFDSNPGPASIPLALTNVRFVDPGTESTTLTVPIVYLKRADGSPYYLQNTSARAFLQRGPAFADQPNGGTPASGDLVDLGVPKADQLLARGAAMGDQLCVYDLDAGYIGCETALQGDEQLTMRPSPDWRPEITVTPVNSRTITLDVTGVPPGLVLKAQLFPGYVPIGAPRLYEVELGASASGYSGGFSQAATVVDPALAGSIRVWVQGQAGLQEAIVDYTLGGNPGKQRVLRAPRGSWGKQRVLRAPVLSADGRAIIYGLDAEFPDDTFYAFQSVATLPAPPVWATVVGQGYRLSVSRGAPDPAGTSINIAYLGGEVPPGEEAGIQIYFLAAGAAEWRPLETRLDTSVNEASAQVPGPGLYVLMTSVALPLPRVGWNLIAYPVAPTRPVTEALASITGQYSTVYGYTANPAGDPWHVYDATSPTYVNDLGELAYGNGYWIFTSQPTTLLLKGPLARPALALASGERIPVPPATYYGVVKAQAGFTPQAGQFLQALVDGRECGAALTRLFEGQIVYVIDVDNDAVRPGCGASGRSLLFRTANGQVLASTVWSGIGLHALILGQ